MTSVVGLTEILNVTVTPTPGSVQDTNTKQVAGNSVDTGIGASGAGTQRVSLSSDSGVAVNNFPATQAVTGTVAATQSGTWNINSVTSLPAITGSVSVTNFPATQAVSGTVAATQSGAWTTGRTWLLGSGTDSVTIVPSGTQTVSGSVSILNFPATQAVSGTVSATQSGVWSVGRTWALSSGTDSVSATISGTPSVSVSNFPATQPVSIASTVSTKPDGTNWTLTGTSANVNVTNTVPVSGTFWQATQPVSGTVAATQSGTWDINSITTLPSLPAGSNAIGSVSVSNFPATQPVSGSVSVSNFPATQTVTGTVAATQSGTWDINSITTLPSITGSVSVSNFPSVQTVTQAEGSTIEVSSSALPTNAAQEMAGQLQAVADVLEQVLIEIRVTNALLSGLSQARPDDPELIRSDLINSLQ
jgi:hypothetical protein